MPLDITLEQAPELENPAVVAHLVKSAWERGVLRYKLHSTQLKMLEAYEQSSSRKFYLLCSRRLGKSYLLLTLAFEQALKKPNARVLFLAPHGRHAASIATDLASDILSDCPAAFRPTYQSQMHTFTFPHNGSIIRMMGVNNEAHGDLRGGANDLVLVDEAGLVDNLKMVVSDVITPTLMTTGGRAILATTPPLTPSHDSVMIYHDLAAKGAAVKFTIADSPHVSQATKIEYLIDAGEAPERAEGVLSGTLEAESTTTQREYLCQIVTDANRMVLPEFIRARKEIVKPVSHTEFFDAYVSMDPGMADGTGILFAWYDFLAGVIVVEDELLLNQANTSEIAKAIKEKEALRWPGRTPFMRVSDVDLRLIADLAQMHELSFNKTKKEDSIGAINLLRTDIQSHRLIIDPRCVQLIRQIEGCIWNTKSTDFARGGETSPDKHWDLVAALKYLVRSVVRNRNPYPDHYYAVGGRLGPPAGSWLSPKSHRVRPSLYDDTPLGRKLAKRPR